MILILVSSQTRYSQSDSPRTDVNTSHSASVADPFNFTFLDSDPSRWKRQTERPSLDRLSEL